MTGKKKNENEEEKKLQKINELFTIPSEEVKPFINKAREMSWKEFGRKLKAYYPGRAFPSISITGEKCEQNCLYCNGHYLKGMKSIESPEALYDYALKLETKGGTGMLVSGGYTEEMKLPIEPFLEAIGKIKEETKLKINLHSGLVSKEEARALAEANIDIISYDLIADNKILEEILRNGKTTKEYIKSMENLLDVGLTVVPHICLGLYYGTNRGTKEAIDQALRYQPPLIVFLTLIPTKGTIMEETPPVGLDYLSRVLVYTRLKNPKTEQSLGCMRIRKKEYEKIALATGINRIAVPKSKTIEKAREKYQLKIIRNERCCAF
ncbi:radical SAM protein [Candidatus Heimdallarchaeota archaeon]|nr:MAG: radical SAM protein [Candidatus Heimdallarchaeota archaeon]